MVIHESSYLFVDGGYLRRCYKDALETFYGLPVELKISFEYLRQRTSYRNSINRKCFFYDCLPDESDARFATEALFRKINSCDSWHVHLGVLRGTQRLVRQKHIDTLMAVEMLTHAFNGNTKTMILVAGDSDHLPVIDALNKLGITTVLLGADHNTAQDLKDAIDVYQQLTFRHLYDWLDGSFKSNNWDPNSERDAEGEVPSASPFIVGQYWEGLKVKAWTNSIGAFALYERLNAKPRRVECENLEKLKLYLKWTLPQLSWRES